MITGLKKKIKGILINRKCLDTFANATLYLTYAITIILIAVFALFLMHRIAVFYLVLISIIFIVGLPISFVFLVMWLNYINQFVKTVPQARVSKRDRNRPDYQGMTPFAVCLIATTFSIVSPMFWSLPYHSGVMLSAGVIATSIFIIFDQIQRARSVNKKQKRYDRKYPKVK